MRRAVAPSAWQLLVLLVAPLLVFSNTLDNGLYLDDVYRVQDNPALEQVRPLSRHFLDPSTSTPNPRLVQYRPLLPLSLSLSVALAEATGLERLTALHLGNLAVHVVTTVLLYLLVLHLLGAWCGWPGVAARRAAWIGSLAWALHPVSAVPINYICARDLQLMMLFLVASLLVYARMRARGDSLLGWTGALTCLSLSLLAKQNAVAAPAVVLAFELIVVRSRARSPAPWLRAAAFALPVAGFFLWTRYGVGFWDLDQLQGELPRQTYALTMLRTHVSYYLRNLVWPFAMRPLPAIEPATSWSEPGVLLGLVVIGGSLVLAWRLARRHPVAAWGLWTYWLLFAPTSSLKVMRYLAADYRQYPSLAFLLMAAAILALGRPGRRLGGAALLGLALYGGVASHLHANPLWRSGETLWGHSVAHGGAVQAHVNYGREIAASRPDEARHHFEEALRRHPGQVYALINLGRLLVSQGAVDEGLQRLRQAAHEVRPDWALTHVWLARTLSELGRDEEALEEALVATRLEPDDLDSAWQAARCLQRAGRVAESLPLLERVAAVDPGHHDTRFLLAWALHHGDRFREAEAHYRAWLEAVPDHYQGRFNLAHGLMRSERWAEALEQFERARALQDSPDVQAHMATCLEGLGRAAEAAPFRDAWRRAQQDG